MTFPKNRLPGSYNEKQQFRINKRVATLIQNHKGQLVKFRDLPLEAKLAVAYYMALDGEAWNAPDTLYAAYRKANDYGREHNWKGKQFDTLTKAAKQLFIDTIDHFVRDYGDEEFGYVAAVPIRTLIESCMKDRELAQDWNGLEGWKPYHKWYIGRGSKHAATSDLWPVILSCFPDETLQDGWTRFHQYVDRHLETCPAIFYPRQEKS